MVRPVNAVSPQKEAEVDDMIAEMTKKFEQDIRFLEMAKRDFTAEYCDHVADQFKQLLPKEVLNMKVKDFIKQMEEQQAGDDEQELADNTYHSVHPADPKTPTSSMTHPAYYKSVTMADGTHLKIPSCITPRVQGTSQKARPSKFGELLFSVRGTPVMPSVTAANLLEAKKQDAIVQKLLHQDDVLLTPQTRQIIAKLKEIVNKKAGLQDSD